MDEEQWARLRREAPTIGSQEVKAVVGTEEWKTSPKKFQSGAQDIDYNLIVANLV